MSSIYEKVNEKFLSLSDNEKKVIEYILRYNNISKIKLKTIESNIFVSSATIIRACKKIGYNSFNQLKFDLINSSNSESDLKTKKSTLEELKYKFSTDFNKTIELLKEEKVDDFVKSILHAKRIFCVGIGTSSMVASEFNRQLKLLGLWTNDYLEKYAIETISSISKKGDVIVIFSLSGENSEINTVLLKSKAKGVKILSVTELGNSTLFEMSSHELQVFNSKTYRTKIRSRLMFHLVSSIIIEKIIMSLEYK